MNTPRVSVIGAALLVFAATAAAGAEPKRPITAADLWAFKRVGPPALSPDGRGAVVAVQEWSVDKNKSTTKLKPKPASRRCHLFPAVRDWVQPPDPEFRHRSPELDLIRKSLASVRARKPSYGAGLSVVDACRHVEEDVDKLSASADQPCLDIVEPLAVEGPSDQLPTLAWIGEEILERVTLVLPRIREVEKLRTKCRADSVQARCPGHKAIGGLRAIAVKGNSHIKKLASRVSILERLSHSPRAVAVTPDHCREEGILRRAL